MQFNYPLRMHRGFSFLELMVVIVIIGLLASGVMVGSRHMLDKAKISRTRSDLAAYKSAIEAFYAENSRYPSNEEGLAVLAGKFIDKLRLDPWKRPYQYNSPGRNAPYEVISLGADGREGGEGVDSDLNSDDEDIPEKK